jgi:hypothetical protein
MTPMRRLVVDVFIEKPVEQSGWRSLAAMGWG